MRNLLRVRSGHLVDWVQSKSSGFSKEDFAEVLIRSESFKGLESASEVVSRNKVAKVRLHLLVIVVVVTTDGGVLDGAVHAFDLAISPRMVVFCQPVLDAVARADAVERIAAESIC